MNPGENSGELSQAMLLAALEPLYAELAAARARLDEVSRDVRHLHVHLPQETARLVVAAGPTDDLMSSDDRQLKTKQAAAFLGVKETWLRANKHKIGFTKDGDARSIPLTFRLGDLKAHNGRRRPPQRQDPGGGPPAPIYLTKPAGAGRREAAKSPRTDPGGSR